MIPTSVNTGLATYPEFDRITEELHRISDNIVATDASKATVEAGGIISLNMVILGSFSQIPSCPFSEEELKKSIKELVKPRFVELNLRAFDEGVKAFH